MHQGNLFVIAQHFVALKLQQYNKTESHLLIQATNALVHENTQQMCIQKMCMWVIANNSNKTAITTWLARYLWLVPPTSKDPHPGNTVQSASTSDHKPSSSHTLNKSSGLQRCWNVRINLLKSLSTKLWCSLSLLSTFRSLLLSFYYYARCCWIDRLLCSRYVGYIS